MLRIGQAIVVGFVLSPSTANAQLRRRFTVDYQGSASCPSERELLAEVRRRAPSAEYELGGLHEVHAQIKVETTGARQHGIIDMDGSEGTTHREVEATECAEVVRALALILAMAIDPDAESSAAITEGSAKTESPRTVSVSPASMPRSLAVRWAAGASMGLAGGIAPSPSLSEGLFLELRRGRDTGFSPHVRLAGVHAHGSTTARAGSADFDLLGLRVASCPYQIRVGVVLSGCVSFDWGRLRGTGSHTLAAQSRSADWLGPGGFVDAGLQVLPWMHVQLELGALLPLARDRFYFGPNETVHRIPLLAGCGGLNVLVGG
ncbi:MAG: hypothetical protein ABI548_04570 [Polyangiaceae bacterium]